jgi:hypothetical protein
MLPEDDRNIETCSERFECFSVNLNIFWCVASINYKMHGTTIKTVTHFHVIFLVHLLLNSNSVIRTRSIGTNVNALSFPPIFPSIVALRCRNGEHNETQFLTVFTTDVSSCWPTSCVN